MKLRDHRLGELWRVERLGRVMVACGPVWFLLGHAEALCRLTSSEGWSFAVCVGGAEVGRVDSSGLLQEPAGSGLADELEAAA